MSEQFHFDPATYRDTAMALVPAYERLQAAVAEATRGVEARRMLELGTGTGETALRVLPLHPAARLVGIDESPAMLEHARAALPQCEFRVGRLEDPLPPGPFEVVFSALAVHHLVAVDKADLFRRVAVVLAPGGRFVVGDLIVPDDPGDAVTPIHDRHDRPSRVDEQLRWLTEAGLSAALHWRERDLAVLVGECA